MRRWNLFVALVALGLVTAACASSKETGFPSDVERAAKTVDCSEASDEAVAYVGPVLIGDNCYVLKTITVAAGTTVAWEQLGVAPHNVQDADDSYNSSPTCAADPATCLAKGDTFEHTYNSPGEFVYFCVIHGNASGSGMAGRVIVEA